MNTTTADKLATARAARAALEAALGAMNDLHDKESFDYFLIHDLTAKRDALRWRIERLLEDAAA